MVGRVAKLALIGHMTDFQINLISLEEVHSGLSRYHLAPKSNLVVHSHELGNDMGPTNAKHGMAK